MTMFEQFKTELKNRPKDQREGQWAYNLLMKMHPYPSRVIDEIAQREIDPFYDDSLLPKFLDFVSNAFAVNAIYMVSTSLRTVGYATVSGSCAFDMSGGDIIENIRAYFCEKYDLPAVVVKEIEVTNIPSDFKVKFEAVKKESEEKIKKLFNFES